MNKITITPKMDAETLVVGLNSMFLSSSRTTMFVLAREMTRRSIADEELKREMLKAMDLLEQNFPLMQ